MKSTEWPLKINISMLLEHIHVAEHYRISMSVHSSYEKRKKYTVNLSS